MNKITWMAVLLVAFSGQAFAAKNYCGDLKNGYGPFDYRTPEDAQSREMVTSAHFTEEVAAGIKGNTGPIGGDLDYTLRAIPNHPGALAVMGNLALAGKTSTVPGSRYPVECYFERAMRFQPNDSAVRAGYANYLFKLGNTDRALQMYRAAAELSPDDPAINYNLGLMYLKMKDYDNANKFAKKAYALGFPLPGLKNLLVAAGKWTDTAE
jgi:tetratricopeptide (TPR) repeat protein